VRKPYEVFSSSDWQFLTASKLEGQWFERKAHVAGQPPSGLKNFVRDKIAATVCGFANSNPEVGGLFVLGIDNLGGVVGVNAFGEDYLNTVLSFRDYLDGPTPEHKIIDCTTSTGGEDRLLLLYTPYLKNRVARTTDGKAYERHGDDTVELDTNEHQALRYAKSEISFEDEPAIPLDQSAFDDGVSSEFVTRFVEKRRSRDTPAMRDALRIMRLTTERNDTVNLTNAGALLLLRDPRAVIPGAYVRFLRYEGTEPTSTLIRDETFEGPVPTLIQRLRDFLPTQFARFSFRKQDGSLTAEDEFPSAAWDEAMVNALVHRSYSYRTRPIFIRQYTDRLEVASPGKYPPGVTPANLVHTPRNTNLMEALRLFDYVRMAEEGTKTMADAMSRAGLPPPRFSPPSLDHVTVTLFNNADERLKKRTEGDASGLVPNIYPLRLNAPSSDVNAPFLETDTPTFHEIRMEFAAALRRSGFQVDSFTGHRAVDFAEEHPVESLKKSRLAAIYPGFEFRLNEFSGSYFLVLDHTVVVRSRVALDRLTSIASWLHVEGKRCFVKTPQGWLPGRLLSLIDGDATVELMSERGEAEPVIIKALPTEVIPELTSLEIGDILKQQHVKVDLVAETRRAAFMVGEDAAMRRHAQIQSRIDRLATEVFPLVIRNWQIDLGSRAVRPNGQLRLGRQIRDPRVRFDRKGLREDDEILHGLTTFGAFDKPDATIPIVLVAPARWISALQKFVDRLRVGDRRFKGVEQTFSVRLAPPMTIVVEPVNYEAAISQFLELHAAEVANAMFVVFAPERTVSHADYSSPYYQVKRLLIERGFPSQMVSENTLENPDWKDLNFALDLFAKAGYTPWVLGDGLPQADLFVGVSSSVLVHQGDRSRVIGYANVFDNFGKWLFYEGASSAVPFEDRNRMFADLTRKIVREYAATHRNPQWIHVHHDSKLRRSDRDEIARGIFGEAPNAEVSFVYINGHSPYRLFDLSPRSAGLPKRGSWLSMTPNRFIIATTGVGKTKQSFLGTPRPLEIAVNRINAHGALDLGIYAQHILSLTRLNWASTRAFSALPITVKYAGDIAYLMNVFGATGSQVAVHERLVRTPWFL